MTTGVRLTDAQRRELRMTGTELQQLVAELAELLGWDWLEVGALRTKYGWKTPTRGTLGEGWPDLTLVRQRDCRLIFAEIKRQDEKPRPTQVRVLGILAAIAGDWTRHLADQGKYNAVALRIEVHVWRPSDLRDPVQDSVIGRILQ